MKTSEPVTLFRESNITLEDAQSELTTDKSKASAKSYWNKCLEVIKDNVSQQVFKTWFKSIQAASIDNDQLTLVVPSQFFIEWIEEHYYDLLRSTIKKVIGTDAKVQYQIVVEDRDDALASKTIKLPGLKYPPKSTQNVLPFESPKEVKSEYPTFLNPRFVFDNFITGESNQFAFSAATAVSQNPGKTRFNPLVIYGDTGLGKTHLAQGIGNHIAESNPGLRVLYTNSEKFTMDFINSIQNNKVNEFVNYYRSIDVLIVDDIQFFAGKEKTQDNFFHTFNALYQAGKQVVLTSDKPPKELEDVDARLLSRFQWGLTVDVQSPDLEMRMAILRRKSLDEGIDLPIDVVEYLARHIKTSIRELEGTLIGLIAKVTLDNKPLTIDLAREVIFGSGSQDPKPLTIDDIKLVVAEFYKLPIDILASKSRKHEIALARQMSIYLAKQLTNNSLKTIGSYFGGRDHSTVLHSCQTIENYLETDKKVKGSYESLLSQLRNEL